MNPDMIAEPDRVGVNARTTTGTTTGTTTAEELADRHPVLDELPHLGTLLSLVRQADELLARAVDLLVELDASGVVSAATGVGVEGWLSIVARRTSTDVRMLRTAARVCRRLPSLRAGFLEGRLSWSQVRSVALACHRLPELLDEHVDAALARILVETVDGEPDAVLFAVRQAMASIEPSSVTRRTTPAREFLAMQPRLDGSGGQLFAQVGPFAWATLDAALNAPWKGARRDDQRSRVDEGRGRAVDNRPEAGERRLERLLELLDRSLVGGDTPAVGDLDDTSDGSGSRPQPGEGARSRGMRSRPQLLVRVELDALLDRRQVPASLLTRTLGGQVWLDAAATRRMVDTRGADLRAVIMDTGRVVGVGRRTRVPPGWLTEALLALRDTCAAPACRQPAHAADVDHATPWWPTGGDRGPGTYGRTDVDELAPVCARHNRRKERDGWRVVQHDDHTRTWTHPRSGLRTTTYPETWQPITTQPTPDVGDGSVVAREVRWGSSPRRGGARGRWAVDLRACRRTSPVGSARCRAPRTRTTQP